MPFALSREDFDTYDEYVDYYVVAQDLHRWWRECLELVMNPIPVEADGKPKKIRGVKGTAAVIDNRVLSSAPLSHWEK